jgi:hypothetical protein
VPTQTPTPDTDARLTGPDAYTLWLLPLAWLVALGASLETAQGGTGPFTSLPLAVALAVVVRVGRAQPGFKPLAVFCVATWVLAGVAQFGLPYMNRGFGTQAMHGILRLPYVPHALAGVAVLLALASTRFGARALMGGRLLDDGEAHPGLLGFLVVGTPVLLVLAAGASVGDRFLMQGEWTRDVLWEASLPSRGDAFSGPTASLGNQLALGLTAVGVALAAVGLGIDRTVAEVRGRLGLSGDPTRSLLMGASVGLVFGCLITYQHRLPPAGEAPTVLLGLCLAQVGGELLLRGVLQPATGPFWPIALGCAAALLHGDPRLLGAMALWQILMATVRHFVGVPAVLVAPLAAGGVVTIVWRIAAGATSQGGMS